MAVLTKGNSAYPFWGSRLNLIGGLDPLGLQTTSEAIYASLLPGITNLTDHIRYYGFYCWLMDLYQEKEEKGDEKEQNRFLRRAELMIALIMKSERPEVTQITGSDFASGLLEKAPSSFDLVAGADKDSGSPVLYWKYSSGAFGQYYFGALNTLNLISRFHSKDGGQIFKLAENSDKHRVSGKRLADAFGKNIPTAIRESFYNTIKSGVLYKEQTKEFIPYFHIDRVEPNSEEWKVYLEMLTDLDHPAVLKYTASDLIGKDFSHHRKETIKGLLDFAKRNEGKYDWLGYINECYLNKMGGNETQNGWYCYRLNDYWQFACGLIFNSFLQRLDREYSEAYLPDLIQSFSNEILNQLGKEEKITVKTFIADIDEDESELADAYTSKNSPVFNAALGFKLLLKAFDNNEEEIPAVIHYLRDNEMIRNGDVGRAFDNLKNKKEMALGDFLRYFLNDKIVNRHSYVALRKLGNGTRATFKFIVEEQRIRLVAFFPPAWTSPRMVTLRNLLFDLRLIEKTNDEFRLTNQQPDKNLFE